MADMPYMTERLYLKRVLGQAIPEDADPTALYFAMKDLMFERTATTPLVVLDADSVIDKLETGDDTLVDGETDADLISNALLGLRPDNCDIDDVSWLMFATRLRNSPPPLAWWVPFLDGWEDWVPDIMWESLREVHSRVLADAVKHLIENPEDLPEASHGQ